MTKLISTVLFFFLMGSSYALQQDQDCVNFSKPFQGYVSKNALCTLSVEVCSVARNVNFQVRYLPFDNDTPVIVTIANITRPPFKLIWNTDGIPNQLITGVSFLAEATLDNGQVISARKEGIFLTHKPVSIPNYNVRFSFDGTKSFTKDTLTIPVSNVNQNVSASVYWNEKELVFLVNVKDPQYYASMPENLANQLGVEILIDPTLSRKPFPTNEDLVFAIPVIGKPYRIIYKPEFAPDGSFKLTSSSSSYNYECTIEKTDFKGYSIQFRVPQSFFGKDFPEKIGCNIIAKLLDSKQMVNRFSLVKGNQYDAYSPFIWAEFQIKPKPLWQIRPLVFVVSFIAGLLCCLLFYALSSKQRRPTVIYQFERSEEEQGQFEKIKDYIEQRIIEKDIGINLIAESLSIPISKLNILVKRHSGLSFNNFIMFLRTEIAKERLRSSHSSETSIADSCGFTNVNEMEKFFMKFHKTTPYKFRMEQQVA